MYGMIATLARVGWVKEIDINLNTAQIILLLISSDFLASDYCYHVEIQLAQYPSLAREGTEKMICSESGRSA